MEHPTLIDEINNNVSLLMQVYHSQDLTALKQQIDDIFSPQFHFITQCVKLADDYYTKDNNMRYIEQVMEDSVKIVTNSDRNVSIMNAFKADLKFSKTTAIDLFETNSEFLDDFALHMGALATIEDVCENFALQVKNAKNPISLSTLSNITNIQNSSDLLGNMLMNRMKEMDFIQMDTLNIINKIDYVQNVLKKQENDNPDVDY